MNWWLYVDISGFSENRWIVEDINIVNGEVHWRDTAINGEV